MDEGALEKLVFTSLQAMIIELGNVDVAALFLCGVAEDAELGAHEEAAPVEGHLVVAANPSPLLAV